MALTTELSVGLKASLTGTSNLATPSFPLALLNYTSMATGTASGLADVMWADDARSLSASATEDLDLSGSLTGVLGGTATFVKLKLIYIKAASGNTNNVVLSRPASNGVPIFSAAGDAVPVLPDGTYLWVAPGAGVTVTNSTADLITLTNSSSGTAVTFDIVLIGTSA